MTAWWGDFPHRAIIFIFSPWGPGKSSNKGYCVSAWKGWLLCTMAPLSHILEAQSCNKMYPQIAVFRFVFGCSNYSCTVSQQASWGDIWFGQPVSVRSISNQTFLLLSWNKEHSIWPSSIISIMMPYKQVKQAGIFEEVISAGDVEWREFLLTTDTSMRHEDGCT